MKQNANPCSVLRATALLAVSAVLLAANLAHGETTAQYVRDGLLACWDGVENAGYRQHAAETDEWVDTVGGRAFALTGVTVQDDRMVFAGAATSFAKLSAADTASTFDLANNGTMEIVYASASTANQILIQSSSSSGITCGINNKSILVVCNASAKTITFTSGTATNGVAVCYDKAKTHSAFVNGAAATMGGNSFWSGADSTTTLGGRTPNLSNPFNGSIYAIRVYSRRLTDDELAANHAVDVSRFTNGYVEDDGILEITWSPKRYMTPNPDYGFTRNLTAGAPLSVRCPAVWTNDAGTVAATCTGWKLFDISGNLLSSGSETAFNYAHPSPAEYRRLEWQWRTEYRVTAIADEGGSTSPAVQWVVEGDTATVTATPAAERGFYRWTNDVPSTVTASSATISFPVTAPVSLFATFGNAWHVSPSGDATAPRASFETGFPTVEEALAVATKGDTVLLAPATYVLADAAGVAVTNGVRLVGVAGPDATVVAAKPNGTSQSKLLKLVDGRVDGITFSNACIKGEGTANAMVHATGGSVIANCVFTDFTMPAARGNKGCAFYLGDTTEMSGTVVRNIRTDNTTNWDPLIGLYLDGSANVHDCVVTNNQFRYKSGGAVTIAGAGAALRRSLVKGNTHIKVESQNTCFAAGVCILAGTLEDCVIDGNVARGSSLANTVYAGGVCIAAANTIVRRCVISNNRAFGPAAAAGLYIAATGKTPYHDLLIIGNIGENGRAGGVLINKADAILAHSTIYGNTLPYSETGTPGAYVLAGTLTDSIVYGNGGPDTRFMTNNVFKASNGTLAACNVSCAYEASLGTGNVAGDPCLADPENGDFGLTLVSPGLDAGVAVAGVGATDLAGTARPYGDAVDMGCYEFAPGADPACAASVDTDRIPVGGTATLTAAVLPAEGVSSYFWTVSDAQGAWTATTGDPTFRYTPSAPARAEITCTARWAGGTEATSRPVVIDVQPAVVHAALSGSHVWPYDTEAKAATNLQSAIDAVYAAPGVPGTVYVHGGVWGTDRGQDETQSHVFAFSTPIRLVGLGDVVLDGGNARRILQVNHPEAVVTNIAFTRAKSFNTAAISGAALNLVAGYATDCVITNCVETSMDGTSDALLKIVSGTAERFVVKGNSGRSSSSVWAMNSLNPVYVGNGTLRNSIVTGNFFQDLSPGGAVSIVGRGVVEDCEISGNTSKWSQGGYRSTGGVTVQDGGTLRRCRVINNQRVASGTLYRACGGVNTYGGNATVEACVITNNVAGASYASCIPVAGVLVGKNAVFRNCLIANNRQTDTTVTLRTGGVYLADAGALVNCTIYGNSCTQVTNSGIYQVAGTVTNCIAWGNGGKVAGVFEQHDIKKTGGSAGYSCFSEAVAGDGNVKGDPVFRKPALGDFHLRALSPCVHAGIAIPGLVTDIEGLARSPRRPPTMGCYRFSEPFPTRLILR